MVLTSELLLEAYRQGLFPMAYNSGSPIIHWVCPELRGQLSITNMHIPRSLRKAVRKALKDPSIEIKIDTAFEQVIAACGESTPERPETWINPSIEHAFIDMHNKGHAHSVEFWYDGALKGGLYGLELGGAFCGKACSRAIPMPARSRWYIWPHVSGGAGSSYWIRNLPMNIWNNSGYMNCRIKIILSA